MKAMAVAPYFHPTTICFVDDNLSFLRSLDLELPSRWAYRTFVDPEEALETLNAAPPLPPLAARCFSSVADDPTLLHVDLNLIEQEINNPDRFRRFSVVVVDYSMPAVSGLDFCARLTDPLLKKIMLTGVADEKVAVAAFNDGLIQRFIPKSTSNAMDTIVDYVEQLERRYFAELSVLLDNTLELNPPAFLTEPAIASWLQKLRCQENIVEYYLVTEPFGFLLLRGDGSMLRTVIQNEQDMAAQESYARSHDAPRHIVAALEQRSSLGLFDGDSPAHYFGEERYPWEENLLTASRINGAQTWYAGIAPDPPSDIDFDPATASFEAYLQAFEG